MQRFVILFILLSVRTRTAYVTNSPSFADRLDRLYEKLEKLTTTDLKEQTPREKLYDKLEKLNSLTPDRGFTDDDEELLTAMQMWGMMSSEQLDGVVKDLQSVRDVQDYGKGERINEEDSDVDWNDEDLPDYPMDWYHDEESETTVKPSSAPVTPSAFTRLRSDYRETVVSAVDPIAATNERPRIMDDSSLTPLEKITLKRAAFANIAQVLKSGKCSEPQPRWLTVRQLAPAANIVYMPPCVQLHRCAPDSGCCYDEGEVCAPVAGDYVALPFYLQKADGNRSVARMLFFNHTQCACVSRNTLQTTVRSRVELPKRESPTRLDSKQESRERQNDWRMSTEEPSLEKEDEHTAPPQLRRCTCPSLFLARPFEDGICSCVCEWPDTSRRRDCQSLARGREHFGMRDRVCVDNGDCNPPNCEFGAYDRSTGRCPLRRYRRVRYHHRARA